jgi:sulfoxide reductase catalytic subunit YedY
MSETWNAPARDVTPEAAVLSRRRWLARLGLGGLALAGVGGGLLYAFRRPDPERVLGHKQENPAGASLYPAPLNAAFMDGGRPLTDEKEAATYCNFYEFSGGKAVYRHIDAFRPTPWQVAVKGLVARPRTYDIDDLVKAFPLEERIYRHRCVEAWAMVVPWTGFPLAALLRAAEPLAGAKYVRFVSFERPDEAPRQKDHSMPWPYTEALTLAEATNDLAFLVTGMYGHPLLKQHGAPLRLVVPWKYGFKCAKSIVTIELTDRQPATFWNTLAPHEYDFWANVNPAIPHPRWSQATERMLGTGETYDTVKYNGYGEWVAKLYKA